MPGFKNIIFLFSFCILFHTGCWVFDPERSKEDSPAPKPTLDTNHSCIPKHRNTGPRITVSEVTGDLRLISHPRGLPKEFTLELRACIKGRRTEKIPRTSVWISNNKDTIVEYKNNEELQKELAETTLLTANDNLIQVNTDDDGCINWREEYPYTYNKQSQWFVSHRFIFVRGRGNLKGTLSIPLIVNPILQVSEYKKVQDYRSQFKDESIKGNVHETECLTLTTNQDTEKIDLIVNHVNFTARHIHEPETTTIRADIEAKLKHVIKDIHDKQTDLPIDRGDFIITPKLLVLIREENNNTENEENNNTENEENNNTENEENNNTKNEENNNTKNNKLEYIILNDPEENLKVETKFRGEREDALLHSENFTWKLMETASNLPMFLYLEVIPQGNTANIFNPFEGIYRIGAQNQFSELLSNNRPLYLNTKLEQKYRDKIHPSETEPSTITDTDTTSDDPDKELLDCLEKKERIHPCLIRNTIEYSPGEYRTGMSKSKGWYTDEFELGFIGVAAEHWLSRIITSQVTTKIRDSMNDELIRNRTIHITVTDLTTSKEEELKKRTNDAGTITFDISTVQNWYKQQRYFLKLIHFSSQTPEMNEYKIIGINPWDYGFTHWRDVTQSGGSVSTTCLEDRDKPKIDILFHELVDKKTSLMDTDLTKRIFCYDERLFDLEKDFKKFYTPLASNFEKDKDKDWWNKKIKNIVDIIKRNLSETPTSEKIISEFHEKFKNSKNKDKPRSFVHLFRSLNPHMTYLIDSSLDRDFYYNMIFSMTSRVVRYENIRSGQQDKGPIRDGIYIFQMTVLKNEQERSNGQRNMVLVNANPAMTDTEHGGYAPLFSCIKTNGEEENEDCLTKEDFIIPPVNIPVIIRDGTMKTGIKFLIQRKNLMFANSKNELFFRLLPADPESIVCKTYPYTCPPFSNLQYEKDLDWKATTEKDQLQPANPKDYDMFFHTYRTFFIPNEWTNWVTTLETDLDFDTLTDLYQHLSDRNSSDTKDIQRQLNENTQQLVKIEKEVEEIAKERLTEQSDKSINDQLKQLENRQIEIGNQINEQAIQNQIEVEQLPESFNQTKTSQAIVPQNISDSALTQKTEKDHCLQVTQVNSNQNDIRLYDDPNCKPDTENRMDAHLSYFARNNALCVIDINSNPYPIPYSGLSEESCGNFLSATEAQTSFIDDLNKQIVAINNGSQIVKNLSIKTVMTTPPIHYLSNNANSGWFTKKIKKFPDLPTLGSEDIEKIIKSGITKINYKQVNYYIKDEDKASNIETFTHALCGLWFDQLLSKKYTNTNLLLNGFRKSMKKTLYYNLRGISPPEDQGEEGVEQQTIQKINESMAEIRDSYNSRLEQQYLSGHIDNLHKWMDGDDSFDSEFHNNLREQFTRIAEDNHFSGKRPPWTEPSLVDKVFNLFTGENNEDASTEFDLADYLYEAVLTQEKMNVPGEFSYLRELSQPSGSNRHPVRKCISNPFHFFSFEKKVIVGEVGKDARYGDTEKKKGGDITKLNISQEFLFNSQKEQGGRQGVETNLRADLFILALPFAFTALGATSLLTRLAGSTFATRLGLFGRSSGNRNLIGTKQITTHGIGPGSYILSHLLAANFITGAGYNYQSYESASRDKMQTLRVAQSVTLNAEHMSITLPLKSYKECLVVRPRFSAFETYTGKYEHIWATDNKILRSIYENIGVMLCSDGKDPERTIKEHYYYVYPDTAINGVSADPRNIHNKPFIISLRGKNEWKKFKDSLNCYISKDTGHLKNNHDCMDPDSGNFDYLFHNNIEFAENLREGFHTPRLMHLTGHSPGVYSEEVALTKIDTTPPDRTKMQKFINFWVDRAGMDMDIEGIIRNDTETQNE